MAKYIDIEATAEKIYGKWGCDPAYYFGDKERGDEAWRDNIVLEMLEKAERDMVVFDSTKPTENIPTADADELATLTDAIKRGLLIPVIRCGQCRYWDELPASTIAPEYHLCKRIAYHASTADGYCDRAERKEKADG